MFKPLFGRTKGTEEDFTGRIEHQSRPDLSTHDGNGRCLCLPEEIIPGT